MSDYTIQIYKDSYGKLRPWFGKVSFHGSFVYHTDGFHTKKTLVDTIGGLLDKNSIDFIRDFTLDRSSRGRREGVNHAF